MATPPSRRRVALFPERFRAEVLRGKLNKLRGAIKLLWRPFMLVGGW